MDPVSSVGLGWFCEVKITQCQRNACVLTQMSYLSTGIETVRAQKSGEVGMVRAAAIEEEGEEEDAEGAASDDGKRLRKRKPRRKRRRSVWVWRPDAA